MMSRESYSARGVQPIRIDLRGFVDPVQAMIRVDNSTVVLGAGTPSDLSAAILIDVLAA